MAPPASLDQNDYEAQRQANIAKNQALLRELQLNAAKAGLGITSTSSKPTSSAHAPADRSHRKKPTAASTRSKPAEPVGPRRTSSRLAGLQADSEGAKRKAEEEYAAVQEAARAKRRRVAGDLELSSLLLEGKGWGRSMGFLGDVVGRGKYEGTFSQRDVEETKDKGLKALRQRMSELKLYEEFPPNSMFMDSLPVEIADLDRSQR